MRYNLLPYNRNNDNELELISECLFEQSLAVDFSKTIFEKSLCVFNESLKLSLELIKGISEEIESSQEIRIQCAYTVGIVNKLSYRDKINIMQYFSKDISTKVEFEYAIATDMFLSTMIKSVIQHMEDIHLS